jgi:hypothetical protein
MAFVPSTSHCIIIGNPVFCSQLAYTTGGVTSGAFLGLFSLGIFFPRANSKVSSVSHRLLRFKSVPRLSLRLI